MSDVSIRRHTEDSAPDLGVLVEASLAEGLGLVRRTLADWSEGANRFDRPGEAFFVAAIDRVTVGAGGLNVDPFTTEPDVARIRHLYVLPAYRRRRVGRHLVEACLTAGRGAFGRVRLRTTDPGAACFYESIGFSRVAEESATHSMRL